MTAPCKNPSRPGGHRPPRAVIGTCLYPQAKGREVRFKSIGAAGRWLLPERPATAAAQISWCLAKRLHTAYRVKWRYAP